jgi:hypothetical protein
VQQLLDAGQIFFPRMDPNREGTILAAVNIDAVASKAVLLQPLAGLFSLLVCRE